MSVVAAELLPEDTELERSLRPRSLEDFVGQERVKEQLSIALAAAKARGEALDHVLLAGPPGLGKTSLAYIVRNELGVASARSPGRRSSGKATSPRSSRASTIAMSSSSTRSTG